MGPPALTSCHPLGRGGAYLKCAFGTRIWLTGAYFGGSKLEGSVTKLRFRIAMSLDGFSAGPEQSKRNPLGIGGGSAIHIASM